MNEELPPEIPVLQTAITEIHHKQLPEDKLCNECMELNLIEPGIVETFKTCPTCGELYCIHAVSHLDPQYCIYCCNDFNLVDTDEVVVRTVKDEDGNITSKKSFRIRHLKLGGDHYLFYNRAITSMSDTELNCGIEYHRGICNGMLQERETRRVANIHRNQNQIQQALFITGDDAKFVPSKKVRTMRTKAVPSINVEEKKLAALDKIFDKLIAKGMTPERLAAIMGKK